MDLRPYFGSPGIDGGEIEAGWWKVLMVAGIGDT